MKPKGTPDKVSESLFPKLFYDVTCTISEKKILKLNFRNFLKLERVQHD